MATANSKAFSDTSEKSMGLSNLFIVAKFISTIYTKYSLKTVNHVVLFLQHIQHFLNHTNNINE